MGFSFGAVDEQQFNIQKGIFNILNLEF